MPADANRRGTPGDHARRAFDAGGLIKPSGYLRQAVDFAILATSPYHLPPSSKRFPRQHLNRPYHGDGILSSFHNRRNHSILEHVWRSWRISAVDEA